MAWKTSVAARLEEAWACSVPPPALPVPESPWPPPPSPDTGHTCVLLPSVGGIISPIRHQHPWSVLSPQLQSPLLVEGPSKLECSPQSPLLLRSSQQQGPVPGRAMHLWKATSSSSSHTSLLCSAGEVIARQLQGGRRFIKGHLLN